VVNSVLLTVSLVLVTAGAVGSVVAGAFSREVQEAADRRLADGARFFEASLENSKEDLLTTADWLRMNPDFLQAARDAAQSPTSAAGDSPAARLAGRLAIAVRLSAVDEALLARPDGTVAATVRVDGKPPAEASLAPSAGFQRALAGRVAAGIAPGQSGRLRQTVYAPLPASPDAPSAGVLRLAYFVDESDLARFRARIGLDASLFFGRQRVATTLGERDGADLRDVESLPGTFDAVVENGQRIFVSRRLPVGQIRSYHVPITGTDGTRIGMVSVSIPVRTINQELRESLVSVLPAVGGIIAAGAGLAYFLTRRVRAPILALSQAAVRLRQGDLLTPIPLVREPELAQLAEQLERARLAFSRRHHEAALEDTRQRVLLESLNDVIISTNAEGRVTAFNPAATELFGSVAQFYGQSIGALLPFMPGPAAVDAPGAPDVVPGQRAPMGPLTWDGQATNRERKTLDVEVRRARLIEGQLPATDMYVVRDVSRYKEIARLREQLLYDVAHELRTPLAVLT